MVHTFAQLIRSTGPVRSSIPREIEQCPCKNNGRTLFLRFLSFSSLCSSFLSFCQSFFLFFVLVSLSFFFPILLGRSLARSKPVLAFVPSMLGFVFFSSNLARVNADGRFELFQFSRDEIQSRNRAEFPDLIFRGRRSLSGFVRISIKTSTNVLSLQITDMIFIT